MTGVFRLYSKELLPLYLFVCILFLTGVVFGALLVDALTLQQKTDVAQYMQAFFSEAAGGREAASGGGEFGSHAVWDAFGAHARWIFFIWILGLSVVGVPVILLLDFLKGVLIGFTVGYLAGTWSWNGILFALLSVIPQNLIAVPVIVVASVAAISFSAAFARSRLASRGAPMRKPLAAFTATALFLSFILYAVSLFETFVSPRLLEWAAPFVLGGV